MSSKNSPKNSPQHAPAQPSAHPSAGWSRRGFLKGAACAVGALGAAPLALAAEGEGTPVLATGAGSALGFGGAVDVTLEVDVATGRVVSATAVGASETPDRGGRALEQMQRAMVDAGSVEVDGLGGATITSQAVLDAAAQAYAVATGTAAAAGAVRMEPGTYTGYAKGYWQMWDLPVSVTVNETALLRLAAPADRMAHGETEVILDSVVADLFPRIIENQSLAVDGTTGATASSAAVKAAVRQALEEALAAGGSDPALVSAFERVPQPAPVGDPIVKEVDVAVVGLGAGGILAMRSACDTIQSIVPRENSRGRVSILGIDRAAKVGGKSNLAHEAVASNAQAYAEYANGGEPFCDTETFRAGFLQFDTTDGSMLAKRDVVDMFVDESGRTIDWMYTDLGWNFGSMKQPNEALGGVITYNGVYTNNKDRGTNEDRRVITKSYYDAVLASVVAQGGEVMLNTEGYGLLVEGGRVTGVKARDVHTGQEYEIHAKAVITNTGGFCNNPEMRDRYLGERYRGERKVLGTGQDTGLMVEAAIQAGAGTYNIEMSPISMHCGVDHTLSRWPYHFDENTLENRTGRHKAWSLNNIPNGVSNLSDSICLTNEGERFLNEADYAGFSNDLAVDSFLFYAGGANHWRVVSDDLLAPIVTDGFTTVARWDGYAARGEIPAGMPVPEVYEGLEAAIEEGMAYKADTLAELAGLMGVDPARLEATVARYNELCAGGEDLDFGKDPQYLVPLVTPPFYALKNYCYSFGTQGGLDVDASLRVLAADGETPIDGLYATGLDCMGVICNPNRGYPGFGGVAQGWLWTSGRMAGINAARYVGESYGFAEVTPARYDMNSSSEGGTGKGNKA